MTAYKKHKKNAQDANSTDDKHEDKIKFDNRGCRDPRTGLCKAGFPCDVYAAIAVDPESMALVIKKGEA